VTWVSYPIPLSIPNADDLFAPHFAKYGK